MANDDLAARTVQLVNKIQYAGNLKNRKMGGDRKLGLSKNALSLPPELRAYQIFLNVASLYVCEKTGEIQKRDDVVISNYDIETFARRFNEGYKRLESSQTEQEIIAGMKDGYAQVLKSFAAAFPELITSPPAEGIAKTAPQAPSSVSTR